uniref:Beta-glucosidase n=1 Tax=uncultured bacterium Contig11 TaxID=1393376 RepID=W0FRD7_9BACT|nr:beta-glucosidase [uncultured bacterium Contig11]
MMQYPGQKDLAVSAREEKIRAVARRAASEGMVLLENRGILPLAEGTKLAVFGRGARYTIKGGTGSGDVNSRNTITVEAGLRNAGFRIVNGDYLDRYDREFADKEKAREKAIYAAAGEDRDPGKLYHAHASIAPELPEIPIRAEDAAEAEAVIYVISRVSGEFADRHAEKGDYYLNAKEEEELETISGFGKPVIILLNIGGVMDLSLIDKYRPAALLLMSQAGSEGGNAAADVISGRVNPSGRLTDTYAFRYEDYPSSGTFSHRNGNLTEEYYTEGIYVGYRYFDSFEVGVRYPFGYGLSYTRFTEEVCGAEIRGSELQVLIRVRNTGEKAGRQVVQLYAACPSTEMVTERKRLIAFGKTGVLQPGEAEMLRLTAGLEQLAVYHEARAAWILQEGRYGIFAGENAQSLMPAVILCNGETAVIEQTANICEQMEAMKEICPEKPDMVLDPKDFPLEEILIPQDAAETARQANLPPEQEETESLRKAREIAARMSVREKACLTVGARSAMAGEIVGVQAKSVPGAAGETVSFAEYGIPGMVLADGPAGVRINPEYEIDGQTGEIIQPRDWFEVLECRFFGKVIRHEGAEVRYQITTAVPIGTLLAQSFDTGLLEEVGRAIAAEMKAFGITIWLAPGMNIHRNPLCGRNFEYYSEDPLVSGLMAAAITRGVQSEPGIGVSIKHFACNNQEDNRMHVNEIVSERALREIYLRGFEIAVKTAAPMTIMTSYNRINGVHSANNYDLCTQAARKEWGFCGLIMTDWSTTNGGGSNAAKCILAGNDLIMPGKDSDIDEITDAVEGKRLPRLPEEKLDESVIRLIRFALDSERTAE